MYGKQRARHVVSGVWVQKGGQDSRLAHCLLYFTLLVCWQLTRNTSTPPIPHKQMQVHVLAQGNVGGKLQAYTNVYVWLVTILLCCNKLYRELSSIHSLLPHLSFSLQWALESIDPHLLWLWSPLFSHLLTFMLGQVACRLFSVFPHLEQPLHTWKPLGLHSRQRHPLHTIWAQAELNNTTTHTQTLSSSDRQKKEMRSTT